MLEERLQRMLSVLDFRTRYLSVVIEDIFQPHNISAVTRSCDCFGIQDIHVLQGKNKYTVNKDISIGSSKWISTHLYEKSELTTPELYSKMRSKGYSIVATTPHKEGKYLNNISLEKPVAIVMGSEARGLSKEALEHADEVVSIPMYGFSESFNISVAAAIILQVLRDRIVNENRNWQLTENEKDEILLEWIKTSVKDSKGLLEAFHSRNK